MLLQHFFLAVFWILFCALHSILATTRSKVLFKKIFPSLSVYYRLLYTVFSFVSLAAILFYQIKIEKIYLYQPSTVIYVIAGSLLLLGLAIMLVCIRKYFINLSGIKSLVKEGDLKNELRIDGIHRYIRHPLYLGTFTSIWSIFFLIPHSSLLVANVIITIYTIYAIKWEEMKLVAEFGDAYRQYQQSVPTLLPLPQKRKESGIEL